MDVIPVLRFFKNTEALSKKQATAEEVAEEIEEEVYSMEHSRPHLHILVLHHCFTTCYIHQVVFFSCSFLL